MVRIDADTTPLGLMKFIFHVGPRLKQPWALGHNRFAVLNRQRSESRGSELAIKVHISRSCVHRIQHLHEVAFAFVFNAEGGEVVIIVTLITHASSEFSHLGQKLYCFGVGIIVSSIQTERDQFFVNQISAVRVIL